MEKRAGLKSLLDRKVLLVILAGSLFIYVGLLSGCSVSGNNSPTITPATVALVEPTQTQVEPSATPLPSATKTSVPTLTVTVTVTVTATLPPMPTATTTIEAQALHACVASSPLVQTGLVTDVTDGDTIQVLIEGTVHGVRYIGMDTPEMDDPDATVQGMAQEARTRNHLMVSGKEVILVKDVSETDSYDRLLRYVFVGDKFVNLELISTGYAVAKAYPPDTACYDMFTAAQQEAQAQGVGQWVVNEPSRSVATLPPVTESGCPQGCTEQQPGCDIKGNINSQGVKIYHTTDSKSYSKTVIDPSTGERWFCTASEAIANGWRAPLN